MTGLRKYGIISTIVALVGAGLLIACAGDGERDATDADSMLVDTMAADTLSAFDIGDIDRLAADRAEIEQRLQTLLSSIEEKERDLALREQALAADLAELERARKRLSRLQTFSWIVFVIGALALVMGLRTRAKWRGGPGPIVSGGTYSSPATGTGATPQPSKPGSAAKPAPGDKKASDDKDAATKGGAQTKRKTKGKAKSKSSGTKTKSRPKSSGESSATDSGDSKPA